MDKLLLLKHLKVEGANAIAGMTWGFPSMTAFLGFSHALQRRIQERVSERLTLEGCAVICHDTQVHVHGNNMARENYFALTRNPLTKDGSTAPFNEEGKMHMDVSLLIDMSGPLPPDLEAELKQSLQHLVPSMRLAGGLIASMGEVEINNDAYALNQNYSERKAFLRKLLPGFALVSRDDVLKDHIEKSQQAPLDAWLDFSVRSMSSHEDDGEAVWKVDRLDYGGWLKPITVGYQGISKCYDAGEVAHVRDRTVPVQFVESIYSIGQWISPHRIQDLSHLFWQFEHQPEHSLYVCRNAYEPEHPTILTNHDLTNNAEEN